MTMTATEENEKHDQSLADILARCVMLLGILVAQGQKGGPMTLREYVQAGYVAGGGKVACNASGRQASHGAAAPFAACHR